MNVCRIEDLVEIESENNINQAINGMFYLLDSSETKIDTIKNQNWFQRMIFSVFGKNKASLKEIAENKDKINKYVAEAITEMYKRNMISESYMVSLGNRINEISISNVKLRRQLLEIGNALNEKIESVDHYHVLRGVIDEGKFRNYPELYTLIYITSSCDKRVLTDDDHVWLLEKSLKKAGLLCRDLNIADELNAISELPVESIEGLLLETNRTVFDETLAEIFSCIDSLNDSDKKSSHLVISGEKLFDQLIDDKKNYFSFLENKKQEQIAAAEEVADEIDLANVVGVYNRDIIPEREDFLKRRDLEGGLVIEDKTTFSKEEIHIKNQIKCDAFFCIEDSVIYINENIQGNIEVLNGATVVFKNCLVIGSGVWDRPFIKIENGFFFSENSIYADCSFFAKVDTNGANETTDSIIEINYCECLNCGPKFIETSFCSEFIELNNCLFNWREDIPTFEELITELEKARFIEIAYGGKCYAKNCAFAGNSFNSLWDECGFMNGTETIIEGCKFKDISGDIEADSIKNSSFTVCHSNLEIKELLFCDFADCVSLRVEGHYEGGVSIDGCSFTRIDNSQNQSSEIRIDDLPIPSSEIISLRRDKGGDLNTIKNCKFSDINSEYEIIRPITYSAKKDILVLQIEKCDFINCKSEKADIIKGVTQSYTLWLGRKVEHKNVVAIINCTGL